MPNNLHLTIYNNQGDPRQLMKDLSQIAALQNVQITDECSVVDPVFLLERNDSYITANYCYCEEFKRYYYINNIDIINGNIFRLSCHCDVLMSHKDAILASSVIADRSASHPNGLIPDPVCGDAGTYKTSFRKSGVKPFGGSSYLLTIAGK